MEFICDKKRHLVCIPYTIENLHKMAEELDICRCWFHESHYDIPKRRIDEVTSKCRIVSSKEIVMIIRSGGTEGMEKCLGCDGKGRVTEGKFLLRCKDCDGKGVV